MRLPKVFGAPRPLAVFAAVLTLSLGGFGTAAFAQTEETVSPDTVLATVGGETITEGDLVFAAEDLAAELQNFPADERRAFLLNVLIDMKVMANAAREAGLNESDAFARRLAYLEERALRRAFFSDVIEAGVTEERIQQAYDELSGEFVPGPEVRARHILVSTLEEAQAIRAEIEGGKTFEEAAAEYGTDGTAARGGDLGWFGTGMMVPEFEEAAFALEVGQLSQPVQSQFGYHLIKLEERRVSAFPPIEQVGPQLAQQVLYQVFAEEIGTLKDSADIEILDAELEAAIAAQDAADAELQ